MTVYTVKKNRADPCWATKICPCKHSISELSNLHYIYCNTVCVVCLYDLMSTQFIVKLVSGQYSEY